MLPAGINHRCKLKIILIGNYPPDKQQSMSRFAGMLKEGFEKAGVRTVLWKPPVVFASGQSTTLAGLGKWLGYLDKWVVFPVVLFLRALVASLRDNDCRFHICDHSNAPYLPWLPAKRTAITCHDVLAIRGALGFADAYCSATAMGKLLQKWILKNLASADKIACVSNYTRQQLLELAGTSGKEKIDWVVIHNAFNAVFRPVPREEALQILRDKGIYTRSFLLHVGSSLPRKNRKLLVEMLTCLAGEYNGDICFAGEEVDADLARVIDAAGVRDRVLSIVQPDHATLAALYSVCDAFIFPSFSEGFGWPVIEAQACHAAVIASNLEPMPEISGGAAIHADPHSAQRFAAAFLSLQAPGRITELVNGGAKNILRFQPGEMILQYLHLHQMILKKDVA